MIRAIKALLDFVETGREIEIDQPGGKRTRARRVATTELRIERVELQSPQE